MTKQTITIDIETLPTDVPFDAGFWKDEEAYGKTSLDGNFGRVLCIGYIREFDDERPLEYGCFGWNESTGGFEGERKTLDDFWKMMASFKTNRDTIIGHNIFDFDMPFIIKRSIINGVEPTAHLSFARYRHQPIFDTMREWDCWSYKNFTGLAKLAFVLGLPSPKDDSVTGANLAECFQEGRYREIFEYCMRDVKATRNIFRKMQFIYPEAGGKSAEA